MHGTCYTENSSREYEFYTGFRTEDRHKWIHKARLRKTERPESGQETKAERLHDSGTVISDAGFETGTVRAIVETSGERTAIDGTRWRTQVAGQVEDPGRADRLVTADYALLAGSGNGDDRRRAITE